MQELYIAAPMNYGYLPGVHTMMAPTPVVLANPASTIFLQELRGDKSDMDRALAEMRREMGGSNMQERGDRNGGRTSGSTGGNQDDYKRAMEEMQKAMGGNMPSHFRFFI